MKTKQVIVLIILLIIIVCLSIIFVIYTENKNQINQPDPFFLDPKVTNQVQKA